MIANYLAKLRSLNIGPSGQANKLQTVLVGIDYVVAKLPESGATDEQKDLAHAATITKTRVHHWKKGITKEKAAQAMRKKEFVSENLQSPAEVHEFLNSDTVKQRMLTLIDSEKEEDFLTLRR